MFDSYIAESKFVLVETLSGRLVSECVLTALADSVAQAEGDRRLHVVTEARKPHERLG